MPQGENVVQASAIGFEWQLHIGPEVHMLILGHTKSICLVCDSIPKCIHETLHVFATQTQWQTPAKCFYMRHGLLTHGTKQHRHFKLALTAAFLR